MKNVSARFRVISVLMIIVISLTACTKDTYKRQGSVNKKMSDLALKGAYKEILTEFSDYPWYSDNDPLMFMAFSEALIETKADPSTFIQSSNLKHYKSEFVYGYIEMHSGRWQEALSRFLELTKDKEGYVWGYIGILEYALYTESITNMKGPLRMIQSAAEQNSSLVPSWVLPYYKTYYYWYLGDYPKVVQLIKEDGDKLDPVVLLTFRLNLLIKDNKLDEAETVIKKLPADIRNSVDVVMISSDLINLRYGPSQELEYIEQSYKNNPSWLLGQRYANVLVEIGKVKEGIDLLEKLSRQRDYEVALKLDLAEKLYYYKNVMEARDILYRELKSPIEFTYYNVLRARIYYAQGKHKQMSESLRLAEQSYPKDPRLLWLKYNISFEKQDYQEAKKVIIEVLQLDPNDVSALMALMILNYIDKDWQAMAETEALIEKSKRYINDTFQDRINSYKATALAYQGNFNKAQDMLSQIKDSNIRKRISVKINSINSSQNP